MLCQRSPSWRHLHRGQQKIKQEAVPSRICTCLSQIRHGEFVGTISEVACSVEQMRERPVAGGIGAQSRFSRIDLHLVRPIGRARSSKDIHSWS